MIFSFLLLASSLWAQEDMSVFQDFSGGLNTYNNPLLIGDNESQNLQNVILDRTGAINSRQGFVKLNNTKVGDGSNSVNSVYNFEKSNGNRYCLAVAGSTMSYSTDGCQTFTIFASTLTAGNDVNCDAHNDNFYCVNNQYNFYFNGGNSPVPNTNMPASCQYIRVHRNRCFATGCSTNLSRVFFSALGDCTSWTTATDYFDVSPQDGDVNAGIGYSIYDMLPIYKKYSTWVLKGVDPNTFSLVNVSKEIGAKNQRSVRNHYLNGTGGTYPIQLFDSVGPNGGQPGIYGFDGVTIREMSKKLRGSLDQIDTFRQNTNRKVLSSFADWNGGSFDPYAMSPNRSPGVMQSSAAAVVETGSFNAANWASSLNISTNDVVNSARLLRSTWSMTNGNFSIGDLTNWTQNNGGWTYDGTAVTNTACVNEVPNSSNAKYTGATGAATFSVFDNNNNLIKTCSITINENPNNSCSYTSDTCDFSISTGTLNVGNGMSRRLGLNISNPGQYPLIYSQVTVNGNQSITSVSTASASMVNFAFSCLSSGGQSFKFIKSCGTTNYPTSGNYTSATYDLAISSPIYGTFNVSMSSASDAAVTFQTQVSTNGVDTFSALTSVTPGQPISTLPNYRYIRYKASFTSSVSSKTAEVDLSSFTAVSTGTWTSPELFLSNNILAGGFGLFTTAQTTTGNSAIAWAVRVSTYSGGTPFAPWTTQTAGSAITVSTGAYFQVTSTFTITAATETCNASSIIINWSEGAQATTPSSAEFQGRYHYGAQSLNGSKNDTMWILDSNGAWVKWINIFPRSMNVINQNLVMGISSTSSSGFLMQLYNGYSDNGVSINAIFQTKDFTFGNIFNNKSVDRVYYVGSNDNTNLNLDLISTYGKTIGSYDTLFTFSLNNTLPYSIDFLNVEPPQNGNTFSLKVSNNTNGPWSIYALGVKKRTVGLMQP